MDKVKRTEVYIQKDLIEFLKQTNPPLEITPGQSINLIMFESGKQALIRQLEILLAKQEK